MNGFIAGAISGAVATAPMTLFMSYLHRRLPKREQYPLPPRNITMKMADKVGVKNSLGESEKFTFTMINHFSYGAAIGSLYFPIAKLQKFPKVVSGMIYGLGVWSVSYMGWMPAIGLYPQVNKIPFKRNLLMIGAHLVWGAALGMMADSLSHRRKVAGFSRSIF